MYSSKRRLAALGLAAGSLMLASLIGTAGASAASLIKESWLTGYAAPGTPMSLDKVGIIKVGSSKAKNVLVIEPGTSGGGAYFIPLAKWLTEKLPTWQVWAVERRENLLEDQRELTKFKAGKATPAELFHYYLGYQSEGGKAKHFEPLTQEAAVADGGREWGMNVAVQDLHIVIEAAKKVGEKHGGKVVLGGHSLGGTVVTAYATWDFGGKPGADGLSGLVYIDGGSSPTPISKEEAESELTQLSKKTPWLAFGGVPSPDLGLFSMLGSTLAHADPNEKSVLAPFLKIYAPFLLPKNEEGEDVLATNQAGFGYDVNVGTSPEALAAAQVHAGAGIQEAGAGEPWTWNGTGAITPIDRYAEMLSGTETKKADGSEWYFPERLTLDSGAVGNGIPNPAQAVMGVDAIHGTELPPSLHILAINSELDKHFGGGFTTLTFAEELAAQSGIPNSNVTLINAENEYAHNDPNGAYPNNLFVEHLVPFLEGL